MIHDHRMICFTTCGCAGGQKLEVAAERRPRHHRHNSEDVGGEWAVDV